MITAALESEREIIATVIANPSLFRSIPLSGDEFSRLPPNQTIWETAKRLDLAGSLTLASLLDALNPELRDYVMEAAKSSLALTFQLDNHVSQVVDRYRCRLLSVAGQRLIEDVLDRTADEAIAAHTAELTDIGKGAASFHVQHGGDVALQELERIESGDTVKGVGLGIDRFDNGLGGTSPGEVCIVAARPGMGKTALLVQASLHALKHDGCAVLFVSAEMPSRLLMWRFLAHVTGAPIGAFRNNALNREQWRTIYKAATWLKSQPFEIIDRIPSLPTLWSEVHRWASKHHGKRRALYVDYLQRLPIKQSRGETRNDAIGGVSWAFTELAKQYEMPVIVAAQLNRAVEQQDRKPQMSDLRDSGNIEQDASQIIFPWRGDIYGAPSEAELIVAKNRNGEAGVEIPLHFQADTGRFTQREGYDHE